MSSKSNVHLLSFSMFVVAGVAHRLHSKHGKNVVLLGEGCQAVRVGGYAHGIVFSAKELKADELFEVRNSSELPVNTVNTENGYGICFFIKECATLISNHGICDCRNKNDTVCVLSVMWFCFSPFWFSALCVSVSLQVRIDEVDEQWCGSLHIGLTTLAPPELPSCPLSGLSPSLPQLRTKVTWLLCGSEVRRNGVLQRQNYGCSLDRLTVSCSPALWTVNIEQI